MLCLSHLGMLAEGAIFLGSVSHTPRRWWLAAGWSGLFDLFDYFYPIHVSGRANPGVYPYLPNDAQRPVILVMTLAITGAFVVAAVVATWRSRRVRAFRLG